MNFTKNKEGMEERKMAKKELMEDSSMWRTFLVSLETAHYIETSIFRHEQQSASPKDGQTFGSYAREESKKDSDLDLIIEFNKRKSILDLIALKLELEKKLGIKVDLLTSNSIHPKIKNLIQKEKIQIL